MAETRLIGTDTDVVPALADAVAAINQSGFEILNLTDPRIRQRRGQVEVLLIRSSDLIGQDLFKDFHNVKLLQSMSAGVDFIHVESIPASVTLCSNAGAYKEPIAEHVFAMILFFAKNLVRNHARLAKGEFDNTADATFLAGKTMGIVGAGGIGRSVARVSKAFNMRVIGVNTRGGHVPDFDEVRDMGGLGDLLRESDFVVVSIPLNVHTRGLIDAKKLAIMKNDAVLVNVARGPIISQSDLYAHLKAHPDFRAGVDVWWNYPRKGERFSQDYPFFELPNFLASPHVADGVPESTEQGQRHALENILRYARHEPLQRIIDKTDYRGFTGAHH